MIGIRNQQDVAAGLFFMAIGTAGFMLIRGLPMGQLVRMGPGWIPTALGYIMVFLGAIIALKGLVIAGPKLESWGWKPLVWISASIMVFALLIEPAGLILTATGLMLVCSVADPDTRWKETAIFAVIMSVASTLVFKTLLQLPMSVWPV